MSKPQVRLDADVAEILQAAANESRETLTKLANNVLREALGAPVAAPSPGSRTSGAPHHTTPPGDGTAAVTARKALGRPLTNRTRTTSF